MRPFMPKNPYSEEEIGWIINALGEFKESIPSEEFLEEVKKKHDKIFPIPRSVKSIIRQFRARFPRTRGLGRMGHCRTSGYGSSNGIVIKKPGLRM